MDTIDKDGTFVIDGYNFRFTMETLIKAIYQQNEYNKHVGRPYQRLAFTYRVSNDEVLEILLGVQC